MSAIKVLEGNLLENLDENQVVALNGIAEVASGRQAAAYADIIRVIFFLNQ
jgi:hypothetical protein